MQFRNLKVQYEVLKTEIDTAIFDVISTSHFISGAQVKEIESKLAEYVGMKHCITCANGTDAITLGLMAMNVGTGDAVFVPDFTFFSSGECPADLGATPIFVDVDERNYNMSPKMLEDAIKKIKAEGKYKLKAVVVVDLFGLPANYDKIKPICEKYGLFLLEDAAQGFGGSIRNKKACSFGDIATTSFFPAKPLGCYGDGGAIFTNNDKWAELIRSYCVHGKDRDDKYNNVRIGMNSRLDTIQAAILLPKFKAFTDYELDNVNRVAEWYNKYLSNANIILPKIDNDFTSSWAQYTIQLPEAKRNTVQSKLKENSIPSMVYYPKPMHKQGAFEGTDSAVANCPVAEGLCNKVLSLPMHPYMDESTVQIVSEAVIKALR